MTVPSDHACVHTGGKRGCEGMQEGLRGGDRWKRVFMVCMQNQAKQKHLWKPKGMRKFEQEVMGQDELVSVGALTSTYEVWVSTSWEMENHRH